MARVLDTTRRSKESLALIETLSKNIVGQTDATRVLVDIVEAYQAGFTKIGRPAGNALFLGPTGTGKTRTVEALCKGLFGDERAMIKIDAGEFQHSHEVAKLIGSPPGYLGHRETHPVITQENLSKWHTPELALSVVLIDEIEKASDALWNLLLGVLDKATLTLGDNRVVDFSKVIILMTSNLGTSQMNDVTDGGIGYNTPEVLHNKLDEKLEKVAKEAAKRKFSAEFFNRINHVCVFRTLTEEQIGEVLDIELGQLQVRLLLSSKVKFFMHVLKSAKVTLLKEGFSKKYGGRHISRAIENRIVTPLARLVASGQVLDQDVVLISDVGKANFEFAVEEKYALRSKA